METSTGTVHFFIVKQVHCTNEVNESKLKYNLHYISFEMGEFEKKKYYDF
jgi:hypothetical protein